MASGMVRKVDELGRVVIPKEMRRILNIKTGSSIEMFINEENNVVLKKFSEISNIEFYANNLIDIIYDTFNISCLICDEDRVLLARGISKKIYQNKLFNFDENILSSYIITDKCLFNGEESLFHYIFPIKSEGFQCGYIILLSEKKDIEKCVLEHISLLIKFLGMLLAF